MDPVPPGPPTCDKCRKPGDIGWCPAWNTWLCGACRHTRTEAELRTAPLSSWLAAYERTMTP